MAVGSAKDSITDARPSAKLLRLDDGFEVDALSFFAELKEWNKGYKGTECYNQKAICHYRIKRARGRRRVSLVQINRGCIAHLRSLEKNDPNKLDRVFLLLLLSSANEARVDATGVARILSSPRNLFHKFYNDQQDRTG